MKNKSFTLLFIFLLFSCLNTKTKQFKTELYYPSKEFFEKNNMFKINLDSTQLNFKEITNKVINLGYNDSIYPYAQFEKNDTLKNIVLGDIAWGHIKYRNAVEIKNDSIIKNGTYPIKNIYKILVKHYENNGKNVEFADDAKKAFVIIELNTNSNAKKLSEVLNYLTNQFNRLNKAHQDSLKLRVVLFYPPPPPPSPIEN